MGDTWITSLEHMLDESGAIAAPKGPGRNLAEHIVAIVAMASRPEIDPPPEYRVRCRRRPGRKRARHEQFNVNLEPERKYRLVVPGLPRQRKDQQLERFDVGSEGCW